MAEDSGNGWSAVESLLGDRYTREARLAPAFLSVFPLFLLLLVWFTGLRNAVPALLTLLCVFGVVRWITHISRRFGDTVERHLFRDWEGKPTTTMLRYAANRPLVRSKFTETDVEYLLGEAPPREMIKRALERWNAPAFPTEQDDRDAIKEAASDPIKEIDKLDSLYERTTAAIRENSRSNKLVFEENVSYGFQRNFYALKWFAFSCGVVSLIVQAVAAYGAHMWGWQYTLTHAMATVLLSITVVYVVCVLLFVTRDSVRIQAFIYARQLLNTVYDHADEAESSGPKRLKKQ